VVAKTVAAMVAIGCKNHVWVAVLQPGIAESSDRRERGSSSRPGAGDDGEGVAGNRHGRKR
jgi:hypothetical protein